MQEGEEITMNKKVKGFIFAAGFVLCGFICGTCVTNVEAGQKNIFQFKYAENESDKFGKTFDTYIVKDKEKNIEYIVVTRFTPGGGDSIAVTPRLDKNFKN